DDHAHISSAGRPIVSFLAVEFRNRHRVDPPARAPRAGTGTDRQYRSDLLQGRTVMATSEGEPRPLIPALKGFYDRVVPLSWPLVRFAVAWNLIVHGWGKVVSGPAPRVLKAFADLGFDPPQPWFWGAFAVEFVGGIGILLGLFTRFF